MSESNSTSQSDALLGGFAGYVRRPLGDKNGLTAQIYGENGSDADTISALSLTKFLEASFYIKIFQIKNSVGAIMKKQNSYPLIAEFEAQIQRPKPQRDGMIALFFATNGENSDAVNSLGLTKYLDSLVFVEIWPLSAKPKLQPSPNLIVSSQPLEETQSNLDSFLTVLTPSERKIVEKKRKVYASANLLLKSQNFLNISAVWSKLGTPSDYQSWLHNMPCCALPSDGCTHVSAPFRVPGENGPYQYVPFCQHHVQALSDQTLDGGLGLVRLRHRQIIQLWAWDALKKIVPPEPHQTDPTPAEVMTWAFENNLQQYIPPNYLSKSVD